MSDSVIIGIWSIPPHIFLKTPTQKAKIIIRLHHQILHLFIVTKTLIKSPITVGPLHRMKLCHVFLVRALLRFLTNSDNSLSDLSGKEKRK